jgi:uncharacterized protein HemX
MGETQVPPGRRNIKERATDIALGAIKYVVWVAIVVGSVAAVFYTSQASQDQNTFDVCQRVTANETEIRILHKVDEGTQKVIEATKKDLAKTREEMTKISVNQEAITREQRSLSEVQKNLDDKMDDLKTILIRMERGNP